jgi:hypothetical protein
MIWAGLALRRPSICVADGGAEVGVVAVSVGVDGNFECVE